MNATPSTPQLVKHSAEKLQRLIASKNELYEAAIRNTPKPQNTVFMCE